MCYTFGMAHTGNLRAHAGEAPTTATEPTAAEIERDRLAGDLELLAEERAHYGDAREAAVLRERARLVRAGERDPGWT